MNNKLMISCSDDIDKLSEADLRDIFDDTNDNNNNNNINNNKNYDKCLKCNQNNNIIEDYKQGIIVCRNCGQVIDNIYDTKPEWNNFKNAGSNTGIIRCSNTIDVLLPQSSLGTTIGGKCKSRFKIIHIWSKMPYRERSLNEIFKVIHAVCVKAKIVKCVEDDAKILCKLISDCKHISGANKGKYIIIRGKKRKSTIAACLFFACRKNKQTRSPKEIAVLFGLKYTEITKGLKLFLKLIKIKKMDINIGTSQPEHFVLRFCNKLKIKSFYKTQAIKISKNITRLNIASVHTPFSTAISSILLMATVNNLNFINKKVLSKEFDVSEVTIIKTYKKIEKYKKALLNDKITDKLVKKIKKNIKNDEIPDNVLERLKRFNITLNDNNTCSNTN
jgi:transcription initiation factor TFIIB